MSSLLATCVSLSALAVASCGGEDGRGHRLPPETAIDDKPAAITNQTHARIAFHAAGDADGFTCLLDAAAPVPCSSPFEADVSDGMHVFSVFAAIGTSADETPATASWKVDTVPPDTAIVNGPAALDNSLAPAFTFQGSDDQGAVTFECSLDDAAFAACTSPATAAVVDGDHHYQVRAVDAAGNPDPTPATLSWTVDSTAPDTVITAGPAAGSTTAADVTFAFHSPDTTATLQCSLDGAAFAACTSPRAFTLGDGAHSFVVRARDTSGLVDPTPAMRSWTVDATPPQVMITSTPNALSNTATGTFGFRSTDATAVFACKVDSGAFAACTSAFTTASLADGAHSFTVRATDLVGNASTASFNWTIDTAPPVVNVTAVATPTNDSTPSVAFTVTGATVIQCQVDAGAFAACTSPFTPAALADGSHTVTVRGTDAASNSASDATTFTVDTAPPVVNVTAVATPTNDSTPSVAFTVTGATTIQCRVDSGGFAACTSPFTPAALADGSHTVTVRATDAASNSASGATTFTVDTAPPVVNVTAVATPTNDSTPSVAFTVTGATTIECRVDGGGFAACTSPFTPAALADGAHTVTVRGTDAASNSASDATTFTVDTAPPVVNVTPVTTPTSDSTPSVAFTVTGATTIQCRVDSGGFAACTSPFTPAALADGSHTVTVRGTDAASNSATGATTFTVDTTPPPLAFDDAPPAQWPVNYFDMKFHTTEATATLACSLNGAAFTACTSPLTITTGYNVASTFSVRATDTAGNPRTITASWTSSNGLVLHYPWEQGRTHNTSLLAQNAAYSPDSSDTVPVVGGWAGTAAGSPAEHKYPGTIRALSSSDDGGYTASIWVRIQPASNGGTIFSTLASDNGISLAFAGRTVTLTVNEGGKAFSTQTVIPQNQWVQLGLLATGPGKGLTLLVNGRPVGNVAPPTVTGFGPGQAPDMLVGSIFGVDLDDLRFYNRALSGSEICSTLVRGQLDAAGACVPLIPGFELDFENNAVRDTGNWNLALTPPQQFSFTATRLGDGLKLGPDDVFGFSQGFSSRITAAPGHSFSLWYVAGAVASVTLLDFFHPCAAGVPGNCGIRVTSSTASGLTVLAGNGSTTQFSKTVPVASGPHSVVVTEQKNTDGGTVSLSIYVDGALTTLSIGGGNVYGNPSDSVTLPRVATGEVIDEYEFWPRDLSLDPEMLCENGWDGEWDPASAKCSLTSN